MAAPIILMLILLIMITKELLNSIEDCYFKFFKKKLKWKKYYKIFLYLYIVFRKDTKLNLQERIDEFHQGIINTISKTIDNDFDIDKIKIIVNSVSKLI